MANDPDKSELELFRAFTAKLLAVKKHLYQKYHDDAFLRDRRLTEIGILHIHASLRERIPKTSQQSLNRVVSHLSENPKTAGTASVNLVSVHSDVTRQTASTNDENDEAFYSLSQAYGGRAHNNLKPFPRRYKRRGPKSNRDIGPRIPRQVNPEWLCGIRCCFFYTEPHFVSDRHSKADVSAAIQTLKQRHPSAFVTIEDLAYI